MPRSLRLLTEGGIYHVYNRFARGEAIFDGGWESGRFLELIEKTKKKDGRRRGERLTRVRELVAAVGLQRWRQGTKALANVLGVHPDTVSRQAARGESRALEDPDFAGLLASKTAGWPT